MARNKSNLKYQMMQKADSLVKLGVSKKETKEYFKKKTGEYKTPYIHGVRTLQNYKDELNRFCNWLKYNNYKYKKIEDIPKETFKKYIISQKERGLSAYSVHASVSCINKIFGCNFTKKELGLDRRKYENITNNRGFSRKYPLVEQQFSVAINFIKACGFRRSSVGNISLNDFVKDENGKYYCVNTVEKGGKLNHYYILSEHRDYINNYLNSLNIKPDEPIFKGFDPYNHINTHYYRNEYSCSLYNELLQSKENNEPYYSNTPYYENYINTDKYFKNIDKINGDEYKGYDKEIIGLLSQNLGHYRLDVVCNHYLRF